MRLTHDLGGVALYGPKEYATLCADVDRLSRDICDDQAEQFINERKLFSEFSRLFGFCVAGRALQSAASTSFRTFLVRLRRDGLGMRF